MNSNDETLYQAMDEGNTNLPPLPIDAQQETMQPETAQRSGGAKAGIIIGSIAGGLALGGISSWGIYELYNHYNGSIADIDTDDANADDDAQLAQATTNNVTHVTEVEHIDHIHHRPAQPRPDIDNDRDGFNITDDDNGGRDDDGGVRTTQNNSDSGGIDTTIDINGRNATRVGGNTGSTDTNHNVTGVEGDQLVQLAETEVNGQNTVVGMLYDSNGNRVMLVDQDHDGIFDYRATDVNGDGSFSDVTQLEQGMDAVHVGEFQRELENNGIQPMYSYNDSTGNDTAGGTETDSKSDIELAGIQVVRGDDGGEITVATMRMGSQEVMLVDADNDGVYEYSVRDSNHDGTIDNDEIEPLQQPIGSGQVYALPTSDDFQDPDGIYAQNTGTMGIEPEPIDVIDVDGPEEWRGVGLVYASDSNDEGVMVDTVGDGYYDTLIPYTRDADGNLILDHDNPRELDEPIAYDEPDPMEPDDGQENIYPEDPNLIEVSDQKEQLDGLAYDEEGNVIGVMTSEGIIYDDPAMNVGNPAAIALGNEPVIDPETGQIVDNNLVQVDYNDDADIDLYPADPEDDNLVQVDQNIEVDGGYEAEAIEVDYQPEAQSEPEPVMTDYQPEQDVAPEPTMTDYQPEPDTHFDDGGGYEAPDPGDTFEV